MRFEAVLTVSHLNIRREKAGAEDGDLGMDVALSGTLGIAAFQPLLDGDAHAAALLEGLFDAEGNLRSLNVKALDLKVEHKNLAVTIGEGKGAQKFDGADLNSVSVVPGIGRTVELSARLQLNPGDNQVEKLADLLRKEVKVVLENKQQKLDLPAQESGKAKKAVAA